MENRNTILSELQSISPTIAGIVPVTPYQVPEGYFQSLASQLLELIKESESSGLLANAKENPYKVPEHYFENLPEQILLVVKSDGGSQLLKDKTGNPYQVPHGYFEGLADKMLSRVKEQDN